MEVSVRDDSKDEHTEQKSLVQTATNALLFPLRVATSPPLLRTYLRTFLLCVASSILFAFAVIAYTSFYYSYIPIRGISVPVYLQFDHGTTPVSLFSDSSRAFGQETQKWPHAITGIQGLVNRQKYDVSVEMVVPRSRSNLQTGNWMVDLSLRGPSPSASSSIKSILGWDDDAPTPSSPEATAAPATKPPVLAHSRRPAILTYRSWPTEHLYRLLRLPLYLTGFGTESETLHISMLESASFATAVPASLRLELRSKTPLEVYSARVCITARLEGLRWLMYTHRLLSAVLFVALFWGTEMGVVVVTWGVVGLLFSSASPDDAARPGVKKEDRHSEPGTPLSDTEHTFPSLSGHAPLRYVSASEKAKDEPSEPRLEDIPLREDAEADDEEDDFVLEEPVPKIEQAVFTDSGLGTGMDSERDRERERVRRRGSGRSRGKDEGDR
ncbi:putative adipose-regulatory protein-domain-containing protein [Boeremia exigua]|uniref:putative adipose-regulatory protein-domain-containing protein n=1 Tax=Boeremia exigua TaxID=749465 RepID=UPI001E8D1036|nr:putative adipose-regulatory protein-domain-containing protein [Boeremia exigua]KAH6616324.1 putative adipose-regulatory protein-domain-containing protein [Boeremia exigua]